MPEYRVLTAGDTALVVEFGDRVDRKLSGFVLALARRLDEARLDGIVETVPTYRSLMVHYDPLVIPAADLTARIVELMEGLPLGEQAGRAWRLPVCYDVEFGLDLDDVAARTGLTRAQVVERHSAVTYHVYMLGFLPGLAYMGDVPPELVLPRRENPRTRIPAGSLAIGMTMSCIFPRESPCGLHLIARSPVALWRPARPGAGPGALLAPGYKVVFAPISLREYWALSAQAAAGALDVAPESATTGAAA
jgi:KipI family sensor histidine kinase inhibitor